MNQKWIKNGFLLSAAMNFSVLLFSRGFTNVALNEADPVVMSNFGLLMIVVWGMAYLAAATAIPNIKWIAGAFAIEKLIYVVVWVKWHLENSLETVCSADLFAGVFYGIYGVNDLLFMVFFAWIFLTANVKNNA